MREIKFRAWLPNAWGGRKLVYTNQYNEGYYIGMDNGVLYEAENDYYNGLSLDDESQTKGAILEQYTGYKDSEGVEVYEGDILQYNNQWIEVVEDIRDSHKTNSAVYDMIEDYIDSVKVIGNIHENKDLLDEV